MSFSTISVGPTDHVMTYINFSVHLEFSNPNFKKITLNTIMYFFSTQKKSRGKLVFTVCIRMFIIYYVFMYSYV